MRLIWVDTLQRMLQTMAFCLAVATLQYAFTPERPYAPPVAYSLSIGLCIWAVIDLGRHLVPSSRETGWPAGWQTPALVAAGLVVGYLVGRTVADTLSKTFGWYSGPPPDPATELRTSILITGIAGIVCSFWFYSRNRGTYLEQQMQQAQRHAGEARLKLLEVQLEPHMLFNTLANLRALIATDPQRAQVMLDHMIAYLRATLGASRATTHPLAAEFERLHDYLALMAIRMGPRLAYTLELPDALAAEPVPTLLLQPLVENSIKHGLEPKLEGGRVTVRARHEGADVVIEVEDTGVGPSAAAQGGAGFGLAQVRERLQTLYGNEATIDFIASHAGGARSTVRFPSQP